VIAYLDCFSGISGDMWLAALVDAGWPAEELARVPEQLGLAGVTVRVGRARRGSLDAARVEVLVGDAQPERHLAQVADRIGQARLSERVRGRALAVFQRLAEAEARVHGTTPEKIHFHEVGAADALVDVVGVCLGLERLGVEAVYSSAVPLGRGTVRTEHGVIPIPGPATAELLRGVPVEVPDIQAELVTPTGAALLVTLVERWAACPRFTVVRQGLGAGARDLAEQPNVLRLFLGEPVAGASGGAGPAGPELASGGAGPGPATAGRRSLMVLETAVDDVSPQIVAPVLGRLLAAGARDAFLTTILMKKGRPGLLVTCLCDPGREDDLARLLFQETPTLGVRIRREERVELEREAVEVETPHGRVAAKVAVLPDGTRRLMPEYESLAALAERSGVPLLELSRAVVAAWTGRAG
jgi:hypothetical protein